MTSGYEPNEDRWTGVGSPPAGPPAGGPARPPYQPPGPLAQPVAYGDQSGAGRAVPPYQPNPASTGAYPTALGAPYGTAAVPPPAPRPAPPRRWLWIPGAVALFLVLALAGVVVFQARQIDRLDRDLDRANRQVAEGQAGDKTRLDALEGRAEQLEAEAGKVFNPEAVAAAVLPSVFRVTAGDFTGTAFAVGKPADDGGTHLFTNYHVVKQVWDRGDRDVAIERRDQRYEATIVEVDTVNDVARLATPNKFTGLVTAPEPVKSGQQIVVVGAPLGLEDTVTTGVVSASRKLEAGSGTVIQFSAPINPGNSGGPVINAKKQVVGIATSKARNAEGIGLAVPIKTACDKFRIC